MVTYTGTGGFIDVSEHGDTLVHAQMPTLSPSQAPMCRRTDTRTSLLVEVNIWLGDL